MLDRFTQTIIAPITGLQKAAVAIVRLSGSDAFLISKILFKGWPKNPEPRMLYYGSFIHQDDGLAVWFPENKSYTGEETIEMHLHGSPASVNALIDLACQHGARLAEPGEFTQRAFLNGKLDLTQAESIKDTIHALTESQLKSSTPLRKGHLYKDVQEIRNIILDALTAVEASVDFSEEIGDIDSNQIKNQIEEVQLKIQRWLSTAQTGKILREGLRIALVGLPNAGKSSLLNRLIGMDRAIVTDIPGTTRDTVEEFVEIGGIPCLLIDTAGLRETEDLIEKIGIEKTYQSIQSAHEVWYLFDAQKGWTLDDQSIFKALPSNTLVLANKSDLYPHPDYEFRVSAQTGEGMENLVQKIKEHINDQDISSGSINARHTACFQNALNHLDKALETINRDAPDDLLSTDLRIAFDSLGELIGETIAPDLIQKIFHDFCIGK